MKLFKHGGGLLSGLFVGLMAHIGSAQSDVIYDFTGTCTSGCTGTATAVLHLTDTYVPGTAPALADLLSFSYSSSNLSYNVPGDTTFLAVIGTLPNGVTSSIQLFLDFPNNNTFFSTSTNGAWLSELDPKSDGGRPYQLALRVSPVPLPESAWMFLSALLTVGLLGWWRRHRITTTV